MKRNILLLALVFSTFFGVSQELSPYFKITETESEISVINTQVKEQANEIWQINGQQIFCPYLLDTVFRGF